MESPVRICLGAALVVNLLLITSTFVTANTLPNESNSSTVVRNERNLKYGRVNSTGWVARNKSKLPDVALNELHPKDSTSEEHTEKNAKYKDRGRVKFNLQSKSTTQSTLKRAATFTQAPDFIIVTPTAEVKKPAQIISSMQTYKKTKMPAVTVLSTTESAALKSETQSEEEFSEEEEDDDDKESYEKYTSAKFDESSFFTFPTFDDDDFSTKKQKYVSDKMPKNDYSTPSFETFSYFPKNVYSTKEESYKSSDSFFNFDSDLTTPKNDFFDKKYQEVSSSILNHLDTIKSKSPPPNITNVHKIVEQNVDFEKLSNNTPSNKSTVFIKNTKEIRFLDNDKAGSNNKGLSDVHGTSIYYEMTVLSTETYNIKETNDDDCDNDSQTSSTVSTPIKEEIKSINAKLPKLVETSTRRSFSDSEPSAVSLSEMTMNLMPSATAQSILSSLGPIPISTQNIVSSTETSRIFSSSYNRNRNFPKRLNLSGTKDSPNSVFPTFQTEQAPVNLAYKPQTRRFHYTTPKTKPIWLAPRKNSSRIAYPRVPTTIYSEHFDIKDKMLSTHQPKLSTRTILTTQSSEIDPVLQSDVSSVKKIVHTQSISDNSIPSLWKRGSTKFSTSTSTSAEGSSGISDMEIPPTLTAWALASMRSPPSLSNSVVNATGSTQKSVDENELQKVGEILDKKETTTSSTTTTPVNVHHDFLSKNITEIYQNKLPWKPVLPPKSNFVGDASENAAETISERVPAESNISIQSRPEPVSTEPVKKESAITDTINENIENKTSWIPVTYRDQTKSDKTNVEEYLNTDKIPPVDATKSTGFESITKLPADVTTPKDETAASSEMKNITQESNNIPMRTDYEITTRRFSYVPTEELTEETEHSDATDWIPVFPTSTRTTTIEDSPITTYRPKYITTTEPILDETTTVITDSTPQNVEISTKKEITITTEFVEESTQITNRPTSLDVSTTESTMQDSEMSTTEYVTPMPIETTTIVVTVATEINSERVPITIYTPPYNTETVSTIDVDTTTQENIENNEVITQDNKPTIVTSSTTTTQVPTTTTEAITMQPTTDTAITKMQTTTETITTTQQDERLIETTRVTKEEYATDMTTKSVNDLEDLTSFAGDVTTEASSRVLEEEAGSGAAIAIAVSTIGVIALVLLVGLLLIVRRRGRRGVYAQRCTPVSLDAYSLDSVSVGHRKGNHRLRASKRSYGNPAYDDEVTSHPMQYAALANFALDIDSIVAEFAEIPSVTVRPDEVPPGCEDKNRYSNVLPLPETRVPLKRIGNDPTTEYINANYIMGPGSIRNYYIACQAPLSNTVTDFWRMIWEQNSRLIVMLTEYMENGVEKCYEYLPPSEISDNKRTFGDYQIILKKREQRDKYAISSVQLINLATRTWREVTHLWYFWPAKGVPDDYDSVIDFLSEMRSYMKVSQTAKEYDEEGVEVIYQDQSRSSYQNLSKLRSEENGSSNGVNVYSPAKAEEMMRRVNPTNGTLGKMKAASEVESVRPCVAVCASGAGRSCCVVAAELCARALAAGRADVPRVVRRLRDQRPHALSNRHHYVFLYKLLSEYGNRLMGGGMDTI
ncbi:mucin-3B [Vanessa tameamea]|uniref:Mucin-3B n=1 Tax=Vanessa tameamea TaxID=334116 RepID=A0A8B8I8X9_VANTA